MSGSGRHPPPAHHRARGRFAVVAGAVVLSLQVGTDFFPRVDAGLIQLHVREPARTRIEHTEQIFQSVEDKIRDVIPKHDLDLVLDNIGLPQRTYNLAFTDGSTIGVNDGQILISLREGHAPTADYVKKLRLALTQAFPDILFYFQPADMVTQILNFGVASQSAQIQARPGGNRALAPEIQQRMTKVRA
jgi:multidrug efflux pump subunit AcrB